MRYSSMNRAIFVMGIVLCILSPSFIHACGLSLGGVPKDHFNGVNAQGFVSYWEKIGSIDLEEGVDFPLNIGFESDRSWKSPYLGYGWVFPLLDSHIIQINENHFEVLQPDGYTRHYNRDLKDPMLLSSGAGWKGVIDGNNTVILWANCGWKLIYTNGKISSIGTPKGQTLIFNRDGTGVVKELVQGTRTVLSVNRDFNGMVTGLLIGARKIELSQTDKPRMEILDGKSVVGAMDQSLGKVIVNGNEGTAKTYDYAPTETLQPQLTVQNGTEGPRKFVWDVASRMILKDGPWSYKITFPTPKELNAAIERKNLNGQSEFWYDNRLTGVVSTIDTNGFKKTCYYFTSSNLKGSLRKVEESKNGITKVVRKITYDELGRAARIYDESDGLYIIGYDKNGSQILKQIQSKNL